jgi:type IV secretion system protein VirB8
MVDATGTVTVLDATPERRLTYGQALDESYIQQYVEQRERWKSGVAFDDYKAVALLSSPAVQRAFLAQYQGEQSRQARYGEHAELKVTVRSIVAKDGTATVWYSTEEKRSGDLPAATVKKMATVKYAYINAAMKPEDRRRNPLGFQVEEYLTYDEVGGAQ